MATKQMNVCFLGGNKWSNNVASSYSLATPSNVVFSLRRELPLLCYFAVKRLEIVLWKKDGKAKATTTRSMLIILAMENESENINIGGCGSIDI